MDGLSKNEIQQAAQGESEAFERLYRASSGFVYNVAYRIANDREAAEEITQEVFITVYRKLKGFRWQSSLKTWLYRITVNVALNYVKRESRKKENTVELSEDLAQAPEKDPLKQRIDREHQEEQVLSLLKALNPDQRACLVLRDLEGLSYEEIARTLEVNLNTVRSRLKRARERLLSLSREGISDAV